MTKPKGPKIPDMSIRNHEIRILIHENDLLTARRMAVSQKRNPGLRNSKGVDTPCGMIARLAD
jgi:hypothetical protein